LQQGPGVHRDDIAGYLLRPDDNGSLEFELDNAALINSHPMGFYSPDQVLQDARRHRIEIRPVDASCSDWDCTLEAASQGLQPAIRLGLRMVRGLSEKAGRAVEEARRRQPFRDVTDLCLRAGLDSRARDCLADAGALQGLAGHRFQARWSMAAVEPQLPLFADGVVVEEVLELEAPSIGENLYADYATLGTTLGPHPLTLLRADLMARRLMSSRDLAERRHGQPARVAGLVVGRQRPGTASGITFVTLKTSSAWSTWWYVRNWPNGSAGTWLPRSCCGSTAPWRIGKASCTSSLGDCWTLASCCRG